MPSLPFTTTLMCEIRNCQIKTIDTCSTPTRHATVSSSSGATEERGNWVVAIETKVLRVHRLAGSVRKCSADDLDSVMNDGLRVYKEIEKQCRQKEIIRKVQRPCLQFTDRFHGFSSHFWFVFMLNSSPTRDWALRYVKYFHCCLQAL